LKKLVSQAEKKRVLRLQGAQLIQGGVRGTEARRSATAQLQENVAVGAQIVQAGIRGRESRSTVETGIVTEAAEASSAITAVASGKVTRKQMVEVLRARQADPRKGASIRQLGFLFRRLLGKELAARLHMWRHSGHMASSAAKLSVIENSSGNRVGDRDGVITELESRLKSLQMKADADLATANAFAEACLDAARASMECVALTLDHDVETQHGAHMKAKMAADLIEELEDEILDVRKTAEAGTAEHSVRQCANLHAYVYIRTIYVPCLQLTLPPSC